MVDIFESSMFRKYESGSSLTFKVLKVLIEFSKGQCCRLKDSKGLNVNEIKKRLLKNGTIASDRDIFNALSILLCSEQRIVKDDYFNSSSEYKYLVPDGYWESISRFGYKPDSEMETYYHRSKVQWHYFNFIDDIIAPKIILWVSDIHIGNDKLFNTKLINNIYDYAIKNGATITFNLGDIFEGLSHLDVNEYNIDRGRERVELSKEEFEKQIDIFIKEYPKPTSEEMRTFCLLGNHDKTMQLYMKLATFYGNNSWGFKNLDLRALSMHNPSFNMILNSSGAIKLNNVDFHLSHKLYRSGIITDLKINSLEHLGREKKRLGSIMRTGDYDVLMSGHMHEKIVDRDIDLFERYDILYLTTPSTSSLGINKEVAYLMYMYPETNSMEISVLGCDNNLNIYEIERIEWNFKSENKVRARML